MRAMVSVFGAAIVTVMAVGGALNAAERGSAVKPFHGDIETGREPLELYTIYSPPQHPSGTIHHTKQDAERAEAKSSH